MVFQFVQFGKLWDSSPSLALRVCVSSSCHAVHFRKELLQVVGVLDSGLAVILAQDVEGKSGRIIGQNELAIFVFNQPEVELCRFRFRKNRNSDTLTVFGPFFWNRLWNPWPKEL